MKSFGIPYFVEVNELSENNDKGAVFFLNLNLVRKIRPLFIGEHDEEGRFIMSYADGKTEIIISSRSNLFLP